MDNFSTCLFVMILLKLKGMDYYTYADDVEFSFRFSLKLA